MVSTASFILIILIATVSAKVNNTIYFISNAESPSFGRPGLTPVGFLRAQNCIPPLFKDLGIRKIISCPFNEESGVCFSTNATVTSLTQGLNLPVDLSCGADENTDDDCVTKLINKFAKTSSQAIAIVWDFHNMNNQLEKLNLVLPERDNDNGDDDESPHILTDIAIPAST
ncbi:hypothetical protein M422DRAFT_47766 [Sphaerobolus stellatus SS14]|uniref:Uncharacterized protein n=1 Tax=Sphaerobolus stellatus (strain SS14) TaxID=990650 RepID=A0A0C9UKT4_SPHS4|nr:hypothetical protein M422DRAFT_47766 [Sphaerobolus stellatus SS14]